MPVAGAERKVKGMYNTYRMFGAKKAAEVTGLPLHKVYELMRNRQHFPSMKIGKRYYVSEAALREWIMLHTTENGIEWDFSKEDTWIMRR